MSSKTFALLGSAAYVIWGLLHIKVALDIYQLAFTLESGVVQARVLQNAWNLGAFALIGIVLALIYNRRNDTAGFWLNLGVISLADIGYLWAVLLPGHVPVFPGIVGPMFWLLGAAFTAIALTSQHQNPVKS